MLKNMKLTVANILLLCSLYSFGVLGYHCLKYEEVSSFGLTMILVMGIAIFVGFLLCCISYKKHRIGRFNIDIFTTLYLFVLFMLGFVVPGHVNLQFTHIPGFFPYISSVVVRLGENSIGIYEIFLFLAFLLCGLTIGEHKQKYYE